MIGSCWMIAAMAGFAVEDSFIKFSSSLLPIGQVLLLFGLGGGLVFATGAIMNGDQLFTRQAVSPTMRVRMLFEIVARLFFVLALALTPLSSASAILQATPIVVVAGAALLFGEQVGWRRWFAICVGFVGVLIIIRPSADGFTILSLLAVIGMFGFAGRDLASRAAPLALSTFVLGFYGFIAIMIAGALYSVWSGEALVWPNSTALLASPGAVAFGVFAYISLMKAMRTGEVSAVTPFRYTRLLFGIGLGVLWFGEKIEISMIVGSSLIVVSGLFIMARNDSKKHQVNPTL